MLVEEQEAMLEKLVRTLEASGVPYFFTGSVAAAFHGAVRQSHDADIAFDVIRGHALPSTLRDHGNPALYIDIPDREQRQFNVIAADIGFKVDFWPLGASPFDREQLRRRVRGNMFGGQTWFASIEDLILSKLDWHARSGSELQWRDVELLFNEHRNTLDRAYLERWAEELGLRQHLGRLLGGFRHVRH
jgi:hypothetical protein